MIDSIGMNNKPGVDISKTATSPSFIGTNTARASAAVSGETLASGKLSSLSVQLSESATRAASRDASLSHKELSEKASHLTEQLVGSSYDINKARHDAEVPQSNDPDRLERARNATGFIHGSEKIRFQACPKTSLH